MYQLTYLETQLEGGRAWSYLIEMARSHERREDTSWFQDEIQEELVMCNEVKINIASREEVMIQGLCILTLILRHKDPLANLQALLALLFFPYKVFFQRIFLIKCREVQ